MKFIPDHSVVTLTASLDGGERIKFAGKRHCIGIKKTDLRQLFHEFEQLDSGLVGRQEGTGLGLALTKKIVELQNGSITVESEFAKGATFTVVLPINSGPNARSSDAPTLNQG